MRSKEWPDMKQFLVLLTILFGSATGSLAEEIDQNAVLASLRLCYDAAETVDAKRACKFTVSEACQADEDGGYSTLGMSMCNRAEGDAWDVLLNQEYKAAQAFGKGLDDDEAQSFPNLDKRTETLRDAQRAWIAFRDAECLNEYAQWGSGSMRHIAGTACILDLTADRTIDLWGKRVMFE